MTTGSSKEERDRLPHDEASGRGRSEGVPSSGKLEGSAHNPLGDPGIRHWQASQISRPGFEERGNIFFAAIEMTRMPMVVTDPNQPDNRSPSSTGERIRQALKVEKRVNPASGFTHEG